MRRLIVMGLLCLGAACQSGSGAAETVLITVSPPYEIQRGMKETATATIRFDPPGGRSKVTIVGPKGITIDPDASTVTLDARGEAKVPFSIEASKDMTTGKVQIVVSASRDGRDTDSHSYTITVK